MGLLDDLAMGFGLKERTRDYDARTARNIAVSEAANNWGGSKGYSMSPAMMMKESQKRASGDYDTNTGQARAFLTRQGGNDPSYNPQIIKDDRPLFQRALFSPQDQLSPTPVAIGPFQFQEPLRLPGILGMISGGFSGLFGPREVPTVSAPSGPTRVRPDPTDAGGIGLRRFESDGARSHRAAMAANYFTPPITPREINTKARMSILDDYQTFADPNMPAVVGLAPASAEAAETPEAAIRPAYPKELAELYSEAALDQMMPEAIEYLKSIHGLDEELTPITRGPHAGKFMDANGRLVVK